MKTVSQELIKQLTLFAFIVFFLSVPSYFFLVDWIWLKELDENNYLIAERIENEFNEQQISNEKLAESINFWNEIQPVTKIESAPRALLKDSLYTITRQNYYPSRKDVEDRFRGLKTNIKINNIDFILVVETNVEETEETVAYIASVTLFFFFILVIGFWILNKRLSRKLWEPFRDTLRKLRSFDLKSGSEVRFLETNITEFVELNSTLDKLLSQSISVYKNQKEFTENASHELQTPLAVLKNKLDILLQSNDLTNNQYQIAEDMNKALLRSSRINKNLLLLAKIENSQFDRSELVQFDSLVNQIIEELWEHFENKYFEIQHIIQPEISLKGNIGLTEVLINNLLLNAIRHTEYGNKIKVELTKSHFKVVNTGREALNTDLLFKRFNKMSSNKGGSGLGLSIVEKICGFHKWEVQYEFKDKDHIFLVKFLQ